MVLPKKSSSSAQPAASSKAPTANAGARVLVADDNANHCRLACKILETDGYTVRAAHSGEAALEVAEAWQPDLVILDSMLPNKCGLECLHHIRQHPALKSTRVIMCSARDDIQYVLRCMDAGAAAFVIKPYEVGKFSRRVKHILSTQA